MAKCQCGCGRETTIATRTHTRFGVIKGQPRRFVLGHHGMQSFRSEAERHASRRSYFAKWKRGISLETIKRYGGKCACCGESRREFLAIDHIDGGGEKHRKELGMRGGANFYGYLKSQGYPAGYRVLCHNCNQSLGSYGYCPHAKEVAA
jgi:hypothetical protein